MSNVAKRFKERILHTYFVRCDMSLILAVVVASGVGASKLLLECGVHSLPVRYPLALLISFLAFLLLIKVWIWYVFCRKTGGVDLSGVDPGGSPISGGGGGASPAGYRPGARRQADGSSGLAEGRPPLFGNSLRGSPGFRSGAGLGDPQPLPERGEVGGGAVLRRPLRVLRVSKIA